MDTRLRFRRQFLMTTVPITDLANWQCIRIDKYYLYSHPDLDVTQVADQKKSIVLIGNLFDSAEPEKTNSEILKDVLDSTNGMKGFISYIKRYAGRYALLYKDYGGTVIIQDARALREVYYCTKRNQVVCGSQPNLIAKFSSPRINFTEDSLLLDFYNNHLNNSEWIGNETLFDSVNHLMPNHYLDIDMQKVFRYWPSEPMRRLGLDEAVSKSCLFLKGILRAVAHRHPVMMAVTAGMDSRTLLAASRGIQDKIYYFINNQDLGNNHPDVIVPKTIFESLEIPFHVHDVPNDVDDEFRKIYFSNAFFARESLLPTIYNVYFKQHSEKINVLGLGEIGRTYYGREPRNLNSYRIAYKYGYKECRYVLNQCSQILHDLAPISRKFNISIFSLLYLEQRSGNWGSVGNSESDIAMEEIDPFNSILFRETLLGVDVRYRKCDNSILFERMIMDMWPELLEWPVNPPYTIREKLISLIKKAKIYEQLKEMRYKVNYAKHLFTKGVL